MNTNYPLRSQGFVLASTLVLLLSLTLIAVTVSHRNIIDEMMAANQRDALNAMTIAESGEAAAYEALQSDMSNADAINTKYFDGNPPCGTKIPIPEATDVSQSYGAYSASVWLSCRDKSGNVISEPTVKYDIGDLLVINSVGTVNGAEREVESIYSYQVWTSRHAILTEDDLLLKGESEIRDDYSFVHSNADVLVGGQPTVDKTVSAGGQVLLEGADSTLLGDPATLSGVHEEIPYINPLFFRNMATVVLSWDCKVLNEFGGEIATVDKNNKFRGWNCDQSLNLWTMGSAVGGKDPLGPLSAFYYVEGNVQVGSSSKDHLDAGFASSCLVHDNELVTGDVTTGSPTVTDLTDDELTYLVPGMGVSGSGIQVGTTISSINYIANELEHSQDSTMTLDDTQLLYTAQPSYCWKVSIVAEGNIQVGGNFDFQPFTPPILFISGNDISLKGQAGQKLDGLVAAHQEIEFAGEMNMEGGVIAENGKWAAGQQVTENRVVVDLLQDNTITGKGQIRKQGEAQTPFSKIVKDAWRELVK